MNGNKLEKNQVCISTRGSRKFVRFSMELSKEIVKSGYTKFDFLPMKDQDAGEYGIYFKIWNQGKENLLFNKATGSVCFWNANIVDRIKSWCNLKTGIYIFESNYGLNESRRIMIGEESLSISFMPMTNKKTIETRLCAKCGRELPVDDFYRKGNNNLQSYCKDCMKEHGRKRNGTTGEYRKDEIDLLKVSSHALYAELKRRGYKGVMKKEKILE